jgi:hypothetical protein
VALPGRQKEGENGHDEKRRAGERDTQIKHVIDEEDGVSNGVSNLDPYEGRLLHALRSSNLPFYVAVWTIAKEHCKGVVAFSKRFYCDSHTTQHNQEPLHKQKAEYVSTVKEKHSNRDKRKSVFVDIVCDDGEEWVKVSTITENRLLFEIAEKGWDRDDDEDLEVSEGEDTDPKKPYTRQKRTILRNSDTDDEDQNDDQIELIRLASDMTKAAHATRVRYRHPRVRLILPKLVEGKIPEIDHILKDIRSYGITLECGTKIPDVINDEMDGNRDPGSVVPEDLPLSKLLPNPFVTFTATINVDCTLLLAIVSDLSNIRHIPPSPNHHRAIVRQIEVEEEQPLLPAELWPAMIGRQLVCTQEAVKRMREIVDTIGTETEKKRAAIVLGDPVVQGLEKKELLRQFQQLSDHEVPDEWLIPLKVVDAQTEINAGWQQNKFPTVAHKVTEILSEINRSVFLYGWVKGVVTITSNRTVVKLIENMIEENRDGDDDLEGPPVWVCDTARSLVGKEKSRKP